MTSPSDGKPASQPWRRRRRDPQFIFGGLVRKPVIAALTVASLVVAAGYYTVADAFDLIPGPLTLAPHTNELQPFPEIAVKDPSALPISGLAADAPMPDSTHLASLAQTLASDELIGPGAVGMSILDVATGTVLLDHGADVPLTPASSTKLLTAWAALSALGPEHRIETTTALSGTTLTLVGGGDVLLAAGEGNPDAVVGHAGLGDLAQQTAEQLRAQSVTSVTLALDDTLFSGPTFSPDWIEDYHDWVAPVQPLMTDVTAHTSATGYPEDPAMDAARTFAEALSAEGITVTGEVTRARVPDDAHTVATVSSATLAEILTLSLKASDNSMTEVEGRVLAAATGHEGSFSGATDAIIERLTVDGFDTSGVVLHDCSGLAVSNKIPARLLAQIVARAAGDDGGAVGRSLLTALPVGAWDGTLHDRFLDGPGAGTIRAKTGSLDQSASLSGTVVTREGRLLAFAVIIDGFESGGLYSARVALDRDVMAPLADCGCHT